MQKDIVIIGTGGLAKDVLFLLEENNKIEKVWETGRGKGKACLDTRKRENVSKNGKSSKNSTKC